MASERSARILKLVAAAGVLLVAVLLRLPYCTNDLLLTDNADYVRSAAHGVTSVYLEQNSNSFLAFATLVRGQTAAGGHPWDNLYHEGDAAALRHFHVPLGFYADAFVVHLREPIRVNRLIAAMVGSGLCAMAFLYLSYFGVSLPLALGGALLLAADPHFIVTSTDINPHTWFLFFAMLFLFSLADFLQRPRIQVYIAAMALGACACASLEYGPVLLLTALLAGALTWRSLNVKTFFAGDGKRKALIAAGVFFGGLFVLWPGGVWKAGYLKSYGVFAYQAMFQRQQLFGPLTLSAVWENLFGGSWALVALTVWAILGGLWLVRGRSRAPVLVFLLYSVFALGMNLGNRYRNPTYAAEVIIPLLIAAVLVTWEALSRVRPANRISFLVLFGVLCGFGLFTDLRYRPPNARSRPAYAALDSALQEIPKLVPPRSILLVNKHREVYSFYLSDYEIEATEGPASLTPLSGQPAGGRDYLLLDLTGLGAEQRNGLDQKMDHQYERLAQFGNASEGADVELFRKRDLR